MVFKVNEYFDWLCIFTPKVSRITRPSAYQCQQDWSHVNCPAITAKQKNIRKRQTHHLVIMAEEHSQTIYHLHQTLAAVLWAEENRLFITGFDEFFVRLIWWWNQLLGVEFSSFWSSVITLDTNMPLGQHPLMCQFMLDYNLRPAFPKTNTTWTLTLC